MDGRGEKFRGDNDSIFQSGRKIEGQMMSRGDLPRVYVCVVKWRSESEGDSFDERLTTTSPSWNSLYCLVFIKGEEFQWFGKCNINVPGVVIAQPHSKSHHKSSK